MLRLVVVDGSKNGGGVKRETKPRERQLIQVQKLQKSF
jgi:hypothetical protein